MMMKLCLFVALTCKFVASFVVNDTQQNATLSVLENLRHINALSLDDSLNKTRSHNVDILDDGEGISLCHIVDLMFHSLWTPTGDRISISDGLSVAGMSAIALAAEHLNAGNGAVVPELEGLHERCGVRFSTEFMDTEGSAASAVSQVIGADARAERRPCAFLGAGFSSVSMASSTVTGLLGYPQLSWLSVSSKLSDGDQFPLFARLTAPVEAFATSFLGYLYHHLEVRHLSLVHNDSPSSLQTITVLHSVAKSLFPDMTLYPILFAGSLRIDTSVESVVDIVRRTKVKYVYANIAWDDVDELLRGAVEGGVAGNNDYVWIHHLYNSKHLRRELEEGDPIRTALRGVLRFEPALGVPGVARYDAFAAAWTDVRHHEEDVKYLRSLMPQHPSDPLYQPFLETSLFDEVNPFAERAYDATVLLGLAACKAASGNSSFTGTDLFSAMLNISFVGATGLVALDPATRARVLDGNFYRLFNVVENETGGGNATLSEVEVAFFNGTNWNSSNQILFSNGSIDVPADLPFIQENYNFVAGWLRNLGFGTAGCILCSSFVLSLWTVLNRSKNRVIQASQPFFLHLICLGVAMMGMSIIPLTLIDGSMGESVASSACLTFPWLLSLGWCISFSALFSKTMRVNLLFRNPSFKRLKVTPLDVARPMAVLVGGKFSRRLRKPHT